MKNFMNDRIEEIRKTTRELQDIIKKGISEEEYIVKYRSALNLVIVEALTGGELSKDRKGANILKFKHNLPSASEILEITNLVKDLVDEEKAWITQLDGDDDDMSVSSIITTNATKAKDVNERIFGDESILHDYIGTTEILELAAMGESLRSALIKKRVLIIGGITLAVIGAGTAAAILYKHKKDSAEGEDTEIGDTIDVEEIPVDDNVEIEDIPVVDIDEV